MAVLKRIGVMSLAKFQAVIMAIFGFIVGLFMALLFAVLGSITRPYGAYSASDPFSGLGFAVIIVFPIMYGIIGFIFGAITAFLYNVIAGIIGGIELEFDSGAPAK